MWPDRLKWRIYSLLPSKVTSSQGTMGHLLKWSVSMYLFPCSGRPRRPIQNTTQCSIYKEEGQSKGKISSLLPGNAMVQQTSDLCSHPLTGKEGARSFSQAQVPQELNPQLASIKKKNNNFSRQENITPN